MKKEKEKEKPFRPLQALAHASGYLREQGRTRGVQDAIWYIEAAKARLEIAILRDMINAVEQRQRDKPWRKLSTLTL